MAGYRRGIYNGGDVEKTADGVDLARLGEDQQAAAAIMNARTDLLVNLLTCKYTDAAVPSLTGENSAAFERQSAYGQPVSYRPGPIGVPRGLPLDFLDLRYATTREFIRDSTAQQLDYQFTSALTAYKEAVLGSALKALLWPTRSRVNENGTVVYNINNGDSESVRTVNNKVIQSPHSHVFTSGAATYDGADLVALITTVSEYLPSGSGQRVVIIGHPEDIKAAAKAKAVTDGYDFIPSTDAPPFLTQSTLVGTAPSGDFNGLKVAGSFGPALLIEEPLMPPGYLMAVATNGPNSPDNVLGWREHANPSYQGLHLVPGFNATYPIIDSFWEASVGFGVRHRGAAAVMQITSSSTYTAPASLAEAI